jgi:hypothetical protein
MDLTWTSVLPLAATTGIITTALNQVVVLSREFWTNKRREKSEASYLAMRLAVILEEFVVKCVYRAWHDDADIAEGARELAYDLPTLSSYPQESDWRSLDPTLAGRVLSFPNEITSAEMSCQFQGTREGNQVASGEETVFAGVNALRLAQALRKKYHLDAVVIAHVDLLEARHAKISQHRKEYSAERAKSRALVNPINQAT